MDGYMWVWVWVWGAHLNQHNDMHLLLWQICCGSAAKTAQDGPQFQEFPSSQAKILPKRHAFHKLKSSQPMLYFRTQIIRLSSL